MLCGGGAGGGANPPVHLCDSVIECQLDRTCLFIRPQKKKEKKVLV